MSGIDLGVFAVSSTNSTNNQPTPFPTLYAPLSSRDLGLSFALYFGGGLLLFLLYALLRRNDILYQYVYYPRKLHMPKNTPALPPRKKGLRWFVQLLYNSNDDAILYHVGLDAYVLIRLFRFGLMLFSAYSLGFIFLAPVYAKLGANQQTGFVESSSLSNVVAGQSGIFWISCVFVYLFTFFGLWLLRREYVIFIKLSHQFLVSRASNTYTILVEKVPKKLCSEAGLQRYFEALVGDVIAVELVPAGEALRKLEEAVNRREIVLQKLERTKLDESLSSGKVKRHIVFPTKNVEKTDEKKGNPCYRCSSDCVPSLLSSAFCCKGWCCVKLANGEVVDSVLYYSKELDGLNDLVPLLQQELEKSIAEKDGAYSPPHRSPEENEIFRIPRRSSDLYATSTDNLEEAVWLLEEDSETNTSSSALVTFRTQSARTISSSVPLNQVGENMRVSPAKEPRDIIWNNLGWGKSVKTAFFFLILLLVFIFMILFGALTSAIAVSTNLNALRTNLPKVDAFLQNNEWMVVFFEQLSPLLLVIVFALVPPVLGLILSIQRYVSYSELEASFCNYYYVFSVIQVFIFYQISGSIASVIGISFQNPWELVQLLAEVIPNNAIFFLQYILVRTLWIMPVELNRISDLAVAYIVRPIFCGRSRTRRERRDNTCGCYTIEHPSDPWLSKANSQVMLIFTIGIVYSVVTPFVAPVTVLYAVSSLVIYRNQLQYVYIQDFETGGKLFPQIAKHFIFAFILLHLTMMGIYVLNQEPTEAVLMIPLMIVVFLCGRYFDHNYNRSLPLSIARSNDVRSILDERKHDINGKQQGDSQAHPIYTKTGIRQRPSEKPELANYKHPLLLRDPVEMPEDQGEPNQYFRIETPKGEVSIDKQKTTKIVHH
uniref:CSC1/OSCA1-like 7TM region domain-containing protein n=1 Tax=Aplanochytrium stocchinoi TaxID=215587 RepID=A0A7S3PEC3_9STRA